MVTLALRRGLLPLGLLLLGCAATSAAEPAGDGTVEGSATLSCAPETGCSACTGCIAACVCSTGDDVGCVESCGPPGGDPSPAPGGGGSGNAAGSAGSSGGVGAGGGVPGGGGNAAGGGGGVGSGTASGGSGGAGAGGSGSTGSGGTGGGPTACTYPPGPYGTSVGQVVNPNLSWQGFVPGASTASTISIQDYFDCDGTRGIHALLIAQAAIWCGACQQEAQDLDSLMAGGWTQKGIRVLSLIIEDKSGNPAELKHAQAWKNTFGAKAWGVAADPKFTFAGAGSNGLPLGIVIDPRTMKVVDRSEGYDPYNQALLGLAQKNGK